jgi:hypothetical protein
MGNLLFSNCFNDPGIPTNFRHKYINSEFSASQIPILFVFLVFFSPRSGLPAPTTAKHKGFAVRRDPWLAFTTLVSSFLPSLMADDLTRRFPESLDASPFECALLFRVARIFLLSATSGALHLLTGNVSPFLIPKIDQS